MSMRKHKSFSTGKAAWLSLYSERKWVKRFAVLKGTFFLMFNSQKDSQPKLRLDLQNCNVVPLDGKARKRHCFSIVDPSRSDGVPISLAADSADEAEAWLSLLLCACVPTTWPGGIGFDGRPRPLLVSKVPREEMKADDGPLPRLPMLKKVPVYQRRSLFLRKLRLCSVVFDLPSPTEAELKTTTLLELVDFCNHTHGSVFTDFRVLEDSVTMVRHNLFRPLPKTRSFSEDFVEEEPYCDPQWPHLRVVYAFFLDLVSYDIDLSMRKKVVDSSFLNQLIPLFDSQDHRERDILKTVVHRTYSKLTQRRALIRRCICHAFYEFTYETLEHNGIAEMLEILASVINGFAVPIKADHKLMLQRALVPLHKSRFVGMYHGQLSYCMALYVAKDRSLLEPIIKALIRYWPVGNSHKAVLFLNEMEDLFDNVSLEHFSAVAMPLAKLLSRCIGGDQFQVAERALYMWNAESFCSFMLFSKELVEHVLPVLFPILFNAAVSHWHEGVSALAANVLSLYWDSVKDLCSAEVDKLKEKHGPEAVSTFHTLIEQAAAERAYAESLEGQGGPGHYDEGAADEGMPPAMHPPGRGAAPHK